VIASGDAKNLPIRLNARTRRGVLVLLGQFTVIGCLADLAFAGIWGLDAWSLAIPSVILLAVFIAVIAAAKEWTLDGHEMRRRTWLSRPGREPSAFMALGPGVVIVHEARYRWRIWPNGLQIALQPRQTESLIGAMERAGVSVNDWWGAWARRHPRLDTLGVLAQIGTGVSAVVILLASAAGQSDFRWLPLPLLGASCLLLAIDYLPWARRRPSAPWAPYGPSDWSAGADHS
jgi:hypothetical protein